MIVKVVIPDSIYARVYFARGEQGATGATGPQGVQGAQGPTDGNAFALTGFTAKLQIRENPSVAAIIDNVPTVNTSDNSVSFSLTPAQTSLLVKTDYVWAVELTQTSTGKVLTLARGQVHVYPEIVK